jgi:hypothetical protein
VQKRRIVIYQIDDRRALALALALGWAGGLVAHADFSFLCWLSVRVKRTFATAIGIIFCVKLPAMLLDDRLADPGPMPSPFRVKKDLSSLAASP